VRFRIPSDRAVPLAVNRGTPTVVDDSGSEFTKGLREVAKAIAHPEADRQAKKRRLFSKA